MTTTATTGATVHAEQPRAATDATRYRQLYEQHGFSPTQQQVIDWVPRGASVLELGCSSGYVGRKLIEKKGCNVTGVEIDAAAAREARINGLHVLEGSLADAQFRNAITARYDVVIAADVLEHLPEPAPVLEHVKRWLAPHGQAIIAVPNVATWQIRAQLFFKGDFEYQEEGILDRTHLHFFTWLTLHKLVRAQGWEIVETMVEGLGFPGSEELPWWWPDPLLESVRPLTGDSRPIIRRLASATVGVLHELVRSREAVMRALMKHYPNLCAPHVALLLEPPKTP